MTIKRIPLFGSIESRDYAAFTTGVVLGTAIKYDQGGTDVQFDILQDNANQKKVGYFYPRENFASAGIPNGTGGGSAIHVWTGNSNAVVSAFGGTGSTIYNGTSSIGTVAGPANFISEGVISDVSNLLITTSNNLGYFGSSGGTITQITDGDFPPKQTPALVITGPFVQFDGHTFVMTTNGQIWNSDLNSISAWTAAAYTTAQQKPDAGVGLARYQNSLVAFSLSSTEFFFNAGNVTNSPLSPESNFINLGCANQYAFCNVADTVAFFSTNQGYGVYILEGRQPKKISTPPIDRILAGSSASSVRLNPFVSHGKMFLLVTAPVSPGCLAYDMTQGTWQLWMMSGNQVLQADIVPNSATASSVYVGTAVGSYFATTTTGRTGQFLTGKFDADNKKRKFLSRISVIGAITGTGTANVSVSWSDNDYQTFSTERSVNINSNEKALLTRCGSFYSRAFKVTVANDNVGDIARIAALELDFDQGDD